jgi:hypothetical protein
MVLARPDFVITDVNLAGQRLLRRPIAFLRRKPFTLNVASRERRAFRTIITDVGAATSPVVRPLQMRAGDGSVIEVIVTIQPLRINDRLESVIMILDTAAGKISSDIL